MIDYFNSNDKQYKEYDDLGYFYKNPCYFENNGGTCTQVVRGNQLHSNDA